MGGATMSEATETQGYQIYMYDLPKVGEDGKSIPTDPAQTQEFSQLAEAQKFAAERKGDFDRVVLIQAAGGEQKLIERFRDGEHIVPESKEA